MGDSFFIFGCWNEDNCNDDLLDHRMKVLNMIKENIDDKSGTKKEYEFGIVAGDNIYPVKDKSKKKLFYKKTLKMLNTMIDYVIPDDYDSSFLNVI